MPDARVFVSYSHEDTPEIEDDIRRLQSHGYAVFHDRQIVPGTDWRERIANDLVNSALVLFYSSKHSNRSKHCLAEMSFALDLEKPTVVVKIDHIDLAPGLRMYLGAQQTINRYEDSLAAYSSKLLTAVQQKVDSEKDKIARLAGTRTALSLSRVSNTSKIERIDSLFEAALDFMAVDNKGIDIVGADDGTLLDRTGTFLISIDVAQAAETQLHIRVSAIMDSSEFEREFSCERFPVPLVSTCPESDDFAG